VLKQRRPVRLLQNAKDTGSWLEPPFQLSSSFDDTKIPLRGLVEQTASSANKAIYLSLLLSTPVGVSLPQNSGKFL
jgi:hypothetical protein